MPIKSRVLALDLTKQINTLKNILESTILAEVPNNIIRWKREKGSTFIPL